MEDKKDKSICDFYNMVCNNCIHKKVCRFSKRMWEFEFIINAECKHFKKQ